MTGEYSIKDGVLEKYTGSETEVVIPEGVITIGKNAFNGNKRIVSVSMPDTVTKIDYDAFAKCIKLKSVVFPKNLSEIGRTGNQPRKPMVSGISF